jgi:rubredoxin
MSQKRKPSRNGAAPKPQSIPLNGRCPKCGGVEHTAIALLEAWGAEGQTLAFGACGKRLRCERCGHVYAVGPSGAFAPAPEYPPAGDSMKGWREDASIRGDAPPDGIVAHHKPPAEVPA